MSTSFILKYLTDRRASTAQNAIGILEAGIAAGEIKNALYLDAKDTVNRVMGEADEAFLATGPHKQKHHQSDWWLAAYEAEAFLHGAHHLPTALRRAKAAGLQEYAAFLTALLPLANLLVAAKPLIVKRQSGPQAPKTATQLEREAATMTCQCCGRKYLANLGTIAHHGYTRPGHGWQTDSCMGAKYLPFEVDRSRLAAMIAAMKRYRQGLQKSRRLAAKEAMPIQKSYRVGHDRKAPKQTFDFTRANFETPEAQQALRNAGLYNPDFDDLKKVDLGHRDYEIKSITSDIDASQKRYDEWVPTHEKRFEGGKKWLPLRIKV